MQFITIVSLHIYSLLKIRLIFHPKKEKKRKEKVRLIFFLNHDKKKCKRVTGP